MLVFKDLPMDNMVRVTIVDTLQNLLHENCSVLLSEFSSCDDLIEQLSTFADSI